MRRPAVTRALALFATLGFVLGSSCDASYTDCAIACAPDGDCPTDFHCSNGYCTTGAACDATGGTATGGDTGRSGGDGGSGHAGDSENGGNTSTGGREIPAGEGGGGTTPDGGGKGGAIATGGSAQGGQSTPGGAGDGAGAAGDGGSGPWTPRDLAGLALWLDAGVGTETTSSGSHVSIWRDQSGNGNDALQSEPGMQPRLSPTAAKGRPSVQFSPPITFMTIGDGETLRAGNQDYTIEIVTAWLNSTVQTPTYWGHAVLFSKQLQRDPYTGIGLYANDGSTLEPRLWQATEGPFHLASAATNLNDNTFRLCGSRRVRRAAGTPGDIELRINGVVSARGVLPTDIDLGASSDTATIGGQRAETFQALNGYIAEIVFVIGELPDDQLEKLDRYLNEKYKLW